MKHWHSELTANLGSASLALVLAANKADLSSARAVSAAAVAEYAQRVGAVAVETSAKASSGVEALFLAVAQAVLQGQRQRPEGEGEARRSEGGAMERGQGKDEACAC